VADRFTIAPFEFFLLRTSTRFPFRYGIASMTEVPHLFLRTRVTSARTSAIGLTAEGLPPKWFTKDPATTFEEDLPELLESIAHATDVAETVAAKPVSFFELWRELNRVHSEWAASRHVPALVAGLGVALVERAVLDGLCRASGEPLHRMLRSARLGLRLGDVYPELEGVDPGNILPERPLERCMVRHTIGLGDPLTAAELTPADRLDDGLPQDFESSIRAYGLRYFKIKLSGDADRDLRRLIEIAHILSRSAGGEFFVTVDGNENFADLETFRSFWTRVIAEPALHELARRTMAIEQPVHRDRALDDAVRSELGRWPDRPPLIIDESDGALGDVPRALDLGYSGASHKNCKGIVKGIANAGVLAARSATSQSTLLTGEDLCNLGPLALQQDLAMMALLGITHVERNGHHYYRGLSMFPGEWQESALQSHPDFYSRHPQGFAHLRIADGQVDLTSVNAAPFGVAPIFDPASFSTLAKAQLARI
jgi:hypothetical protein